MSIEFLITALIIVATPGVGALYTISAGLRRGARAGVLAAFAGTVGIVPHLLAAITGLAAILHSSAVAYEILRWLGVAYLLYMAWQSWRDRQAAAPDHQAPEQAEQRRADARLHRHGQVRTRQEPLAQPAHDEPGDRPHRDLDRRPRLHPQGRRAAKRPRPIRSPAIPPATMQEISNGPCEDTSRRNAVPCPAPSASPPIAPRIRPL